MAADVRKRLLRFATASSILILLLSIQDSFGQDIWFSPRSGPEAKDFNDLFEGNAPWLTAARHVKAFGLSIQLETKGSDEELKKVIDGLRDRHIALVLDMLPLSGPVTSTDTHCGRQVEGYSAPLQSVWVAKRFKGLGGKVVYYTMDEPLWYGHFFNGANACNSSIEELSADVADKIRQVREQFPAAEIGDVEPMGVVKSGLADLEQWLDAFQRATGKPLSFLCLDIDWTAPWKSQVIAIAQLLKRKGVHLQIIYNGSNREQSDFEWTSHALAHAKAIEAVVHADVAVIESWNAYPTRVLPESDATTMTGLINQYLFARGMR
jgi:hypothetical protein